MPDSIAVSTAGSDPVSEGSNPSRATTNLEMIERSCRGKGRSTPPEIPWPMMTEKFRGGQHKLYKTTSGTIFNLLEVNVKVLLKESPNVGRDRTSKQQV